MRQIGMQPNKPLSPVIPLNLSAPGAAGVTDQTSIAGDVEEWLFDAFNAIYNQEGLLAPRRLWRIPDEATLGYVPQPFTEGSTVYATFAGGVYFVSDNGKIWNDRGVDLTTLGNDGSVPVSWTGTVANWKAVYLNGKIYFFAQGQEAKVFDPVANQFSGVPDAPEVGIVHSAFGRLWAASTSSTATTLTWSLLLNGKDWTSAGTGSLDLSTYMTSGEAITAIADFNGFLIVFTNRSILIFQDPFTVPIDSSGTEGTAASMTLKEQIRDTGCVGKNAWCHVGEELIFMSHSGLKSLGRVLQDGGANPMETICPQINNRLLNAFKGSLGTAQNLEYVILNYHPIQGFVTVETGQIEDAVYLVWVSRPMNKGVYPVTIWGKPRDEFLAGDYGIIYFHGLYPTGGWAGVGPGITGLLKVYNSDSSIHYHGIAHYGFMNPSMDELQCEETFSFRVKSAWLNFGDQAGPLDKIPKDLKLIYRTPQSPELTEDSPDGTALSVTFSLRFDYSTQARSHTFTTPLIEQDAFDVSTQLSPHSITPIPLAGQGSLVQWEVKSNVTNRAHEAFALQRAGFQVKMGRIHQGI